MRRLGQRKQQSSQRDADCGNEHDDELDEREGDASHPQMLLSAEQMKWVSIELTAFNIVGRCTATEIL